MRLGISIDGPEEYHDQHRVDHHGHGSYNKIIQSINLLKDHSFDFGVLSVMDPSKNAESIFNFFIKDLEITGLDFLWPDYTHDSPPPYPPKMYGYFIADILRMWLNNDNPDVKIRFY